MALEEYLHHNPVWSLLHPCNLRSVGGAVQAAVLDLLALQFHDCRAGTDYVNCFLESDVFQGSISGNGVTDIFFGLLRLLKEQKQSEDHKARKIKKCCVFIIFLRLRREKKSALQQEAVPSCSARGRQPPGMNR